MKIIGINGRLHSGKDTAFELIEKYALGVAKREGFADRMKLSGVRALGFDPASIEEALVIANDLKENSSVAIVDGAVGKITSQISGREFWQFYGTESHRNVFGVDFWVDALLPSPKNEVECLGWEVGYPNTSVVVITDVRFPNEAQRILDLDGEVWHLDADERLGPLPSDAHVSEHGLPFDLVTMVVDNNGTVEDFEVTMQTAIESVGL